MVSPYRVSAPDSSFPLRQGEILTDVTHVRVTLESIGDPEPTVVRVQIPFALVMTQDCDLDQDYRVRFPVLEAGSAKLLPAVLLAEVYTAEEVFNRIANSRKREWDRLNIANNKHERFHFLQKVEPSCDRLNKGLQELTIDFKRYLTLPTDELYRRVELGEVQRRCVLVSPYVEHLSSRFAHYLSRVGLPTNHLSE